MLQVILGVLGGVVLLFIVIAFYGAMRLSSQASREEERREATRILEATENQRKQAKKKGKNDRRKGNVGRTNKTSGQNRDRIRKA